MARSTPINSGHAIINGIGAGTNGDRIDVWVEYLIGEANVVENYTPFTAYFYAALKSDQSASTALEYGLASSFTVDGNAGTGWANVGYDFTEPGEPCVVPSSTTVDDDGITKNYLGKFKGNIYHDEDGEKSVTIVGSFTTQSTYISGGSISAIVDLPNIYQGCVYINTGSGRLKTIPYIDNGSSFDRSIADMDNGSAWNMCG